MQDLHEEQLFPEPQSIANEFLPNACKRCQHSVGEYFKNLPSSTIRLANIESSPVWDTSWLAELVYDLIIR